jgi:hypothetical protein
MPARQFERDSHWGMLGADSAIRQGGALKPASWIHRSSFADQRNGGSKAKPQVAWMKLPFRTPPIWEVYEDRQFC